MITAAAHPPRPASRARIIASARSATCSLAKIGGHVVGHRLRATATAAARSRGWGARAAISSRISRSRSVSVGNTFGAGRGTAKKASTRPATRRAEDGLAAGHRPDRAGQLLLVGVLEHVAAGAGAQGQEHRVLVLEQAEHQHPHVRVGRDDRPGRLDAAHPGQLQVHEDDVGAQLARPAPPPPRRSRRCRRPSTSGTASSSATTPLRNSGWSSTTQHRARQLASRRGSRARTSVPPPGAACTVHVAAHLLGPLAHRGQPDAGLARPAGSPHAVVGDLDGHRVGGSTVEPHRAGVRRGVPDDVGQRLLRRSGRPPPRRRPAAAGPRAAVVHRDPQAVAVRTALGQPLQRAGQPELVQGRRAQAVHQPADVGDGAPQFAAQLAGQRLGRRRVAGDQPAQHARPAR